MHVISQAIKHARPKQFSWVHTRIGGCVNSNESLESMGFTDLVFTSTVFRFGWPWSWVDIPKSNLTVLHDLQQILRNIFEASPQWQSCTLPPNPFPNNNPGVMPKAQRILHGHCHEVLCKYTQSWRSQQPNRSVWLVNLLLFKPLDLHWFKITVLPKFKLFSHPLSVALG